MKTPLNEELKKTKYLHLLNRSEYKVVPLDELLNEYDKNMTEEDFLKVSGETEEKTEKEELNYDLNNPRDTIKFLTKKIDASNKYVKQIMPFLKGIKLELNTEQEGTLENHKSYPTTIALLSENYDLKESAENDFRTTRIFGVYANNRKIISKNIVKHCEEIERIFVKHQIPHKLENLDTLVEEYIIHNTVYKK